jgi:hypothetical protein
MKHTFKPLKAKTNDSGIHWQVCECARCGLLRRPIELAFNPTIDFYLWFLRIQMLDHVIIGHPINCRQGYFSFKETGTIG